MKTILAGLLSVMPDNRPDRLYVLVRKDLPPSYQAVQAGHAVAEWLLRVQPREKQWTNGTLIYLGVDDENDLDYWGDRLNRKRLKWVKFREPDIGHETTAIAIFCDGSMFSDLKLL